MALNFNEGAYAGIFQKGREVDEYNRRRPFDAIAELTKTGNEIGKNLQTYSENKPFTADTIEKFWRWKKGQGDLPAEASQMSPKRLGSMGETLKMFSSSPTPSYGVVNVNDKGEYEGFTPLPAGMKSAGILKPPAAKSAIMSGGLNWDTASEVQKNMAKALANGDIRSSDLGMRDRGAIVGLANEYALQNNVPFQSYGGDVKAGMAKNLAYGKMGTNALSLNTALGHVGDAAEAFSGVQNTNQQWLNQPINKLKQITNDPNIVALDLNLNAVAGELATVFKGSSGTDQEIGHWASVLTSDLTPIQAQAALKKAGELLHSRLNALQYQQSNVMDQPITGRTLISPHGEDVMRKISSPSQGRPKTVQQGGFTYTLNEATGQYE